MTYRDRRSIHKNGGASKMNIDAVRYKHYEKWNSEGLRSGIDGPLPYLEPLS
jgi:hypothetical protein